ncbi:MAG: response regulator transcription factor [Candidatus Acidiferrum sp.]
MTWILLLKAHIHQVDQLTTIKVLLADDHPGFPGLVTSLLESTFEVVGRVADGRALVEAAMKLNPDVIVTDISMPVLNGLEAVDLLRKSGSAAKIVFLSVHSEPDFVQAGLSTGAQGYVVKPRMGTELVLAIREALAGKIFVSQGLSRGDSTTL